MAFRTTPSSPNCTKWVIRDMVSIEWWNPSPPVLWGVGRESCLFLSPAGESLCAERKGLSLSFKHQLPPSSLPRGQRWGLGSWFLLVVMLPADPCSVSLTPAALS